jgi:hypothetical protein
MIFVIIFYDFNVNNYNGNVFCFFICSIFCIIAPMKARSIQQDYQQGFGPRG